MFDATTHLCSLCALLLGLPWAQEVELPELLCELKGLCDNPLFRGVVATLDETGKREVLAQWVALKAVVC